ncbi:MAG: class I SAM-dependent methyltransferase [Phaeospirillum sp.]|nr:class I SAM-dependent methyltransferase [Phaeospirillum sp.]
MNDQTIATYSQALAQVAAIYHCTLKEYGRTAAGVAWRDDHGQFGRFDVLTSMIDRARPLTINDVGCGYGALFRHLDARFHLAEYCGTDICEAMIEAAGAEETDSRARFVQSALPVTTADWSIASGTFNMSAGACDEVWRRLTEDVLRAMARHSRLGFAFNMLRPEYGDGDLWGAEPGPWLRFCRDQLAGQPTLIESPAGNDWSLLVLKA